METQLIAIGKAASLYGVSRDTLREWVKAGKLSAVRTPGGHHRFRLDDIQRLINTNTSTHKEISSQMDEVKTRKEILEETFRSLSDLPCKADEFEKDGQTYVALRCRVFDSMLASNKAIHTDYNDEEFAAIIAGPMAECLVRAAERKLGEVMKSETVGSPKWIVAHFKMFGSSAELRQYGDLALTMHVVRLAACGLLHGEYNKYGQIKNINIPNPEETFNLYMQDDRPFPPLEVG